jgi:hypothetical protein
VSDINNIKAGIFNYVERLKRKPDFHPDWFSGPYQKLALREIERFISLGGIFTIEELEVLTEKWSYRVEMPFRTLEDKATIEDLSQKYKSKVSFNPETTIVYSEHSELDSALDAAMIIGDEKKDGK